MAEKTDKSTSESHNHSKPIQTSVHKDSAPNPTYKIVTPPPKKK